jgi:hypothetical protein
MSIEHQLIVPIAERLYRLVDDYIYTWEKKGKGGPSSFKYRITVPAGFIFDGASVPRIAWTISGILPDGLIRAAALVHDWLYRYKGNLPEGSYQYLAPDGNWSNLYAIWSRKNSDRLFGRIMREARVPKRKRRAAYRAVRLFGWLPWQCS